MAVHKVPLDLGKIVTDMVTNLARELPISLDLDPCSTWWSTVSSVLGELPGSLVCLLAHQTFNEIGVPRELFLLVT